MTLYDKQFTRVLSSYVIQNRKLIAVESASQSLWDASFAIRLGKLIKLAQECGLLETILDTSRFQLEASYSVMAMTTDEFINALKYFSVLSYALEKGELPNIPMTSIQAWQQAAVNVFAPFKINLSRPFTKLSTILSKPNVKLLKSNGDPTPAYEVLYDQTKVIRDAINPKKTKILADPAATANLRTFFTNVMSFLNSKKETGFKNVMQNVRFLKDPKLSGVMYVPEEEVSNAPINNYLDWIKTKTKRKGAGGLTPEEVKGLSDNDKETHKQLLKGYRTAHADKMRDLIRSTGEQTAPAQMVKKALKDAGFPQHQNIPTGFTGNVNEKGELHTHTGVPLATGQTGGTMEMNPAWNPKTDDVYYAKGQSAKSTTGKDTHFYTTRYKKTHTHAKKAEKVAELEEKMPDLQEAWRKDLRDKNSPNQMVAAMLEAMYQTQARIGSGEGETAGERTYGLSTWLGKHVKLNGTGQITITYPGKKGMINKHTLRGETPEQVALIKYISRLKEGTLPNDPIWVDADRKRVGAGQVNKYIKELGFSGTAHKFRTYKGTVMFKQLLAQKPLRNPNPTPKEVDIHHRALTERIGAILGHQRTLPDGTTENVGTTAAKAYIDPGVQIKFFRDKKVPVPKWLEDSAAEEGVSVGGDTDDEDYEAPVTQRVQREPAKVQRQPRIVVHEDTDDDDEDFHVPPEHLLVKPKPTATPKVQPKPTIQKSAPKSEPQKGQRQSRNVMPEDDEDEVPFKPQVVKLQPAPQVVQPQPITHGPRPAFQRPKRQSRNIVPEDDDEEY
jgi:hypothetical protein